MCVQRHGCPWHNSLRVLSDITRYVSKAQLFRECTQLFSHYTNTPVTKAVGLIMTQQTASASGRIRTCLDVVLDANVL